MTRLMYNVPINDNRDYMQDQNRDYYLTSEMQSATLISSHTTDGKHAPALDVDIPAALTESPEGMTLWLDVSTEERHFRDLLTHLGKLGFLRTEEFSLSKSERIGAFTRERRDCQDVTSIWDSMLRLSNEYLGNFEELLAAGRSFADAGTTTASLMANPWPIRLHPALDVFLAPSSTSGHSHLYIDASLEWVDYLTLIERLVQTSVVEAGYLGASYTRRATNLRRPGYLKTQPDKTPG